MNTKIFMAAKVIAALMLVTVAPAALATHIPTNLDVHGLRTSLGSKEGYLSFRHAGPVFNGEERTGWTDIRHPVLDGTTDNKRGYDWSDNQVSVLTHNVNAPGGNSTVTAALRRQDFDVANAAYAQAGITVRQEKNITINGNDLVNDATGNAEPSLSVLFGTNRSANANTVNQYYVDDIPEDPPSPTRLTRGYALPPIYASRGGYANGGSNNNPPPPGGFPNFNSGFAVSDATRIQAGNGTSTFAHELGHMLLDDYRFSPSPKFHSGTADDLMATRPTHPGLVAKDGGIFGLRDPGQHVGNIGTHSHLGEKVTQMGGTTAVTQTEAMYRSSYVQRADNGFTHGDRADFDWVEDNISMELGTTTGDNHPGVDFMVWEIGNVAPSAHNGHDHDSWGELALQTYVGDTFRIVDVISQIARYADMDVDAAGNWSRRESALDYLLDFSFDGVKWVAGKAIKVFEDGWTLASDAEDYVARWLSPIDAKFVRVAGYPLGGTHDGNVQIDAIIAAVPEPETIILFASGLIMMWSGRRAGKNTGRPPVGSSC